MDRIPTDGQIQEAMPVAFRVVIRIMRSWGFSNFELACALDIDEKQLEQFDERGLPDRSVDHELVKRVSYILGIQKQLEILLGDSDDIKRWINHASNASILDGASPKFNLISGDIQKLADIRDYLQGWSSGDFS